MIHVAGHMIQFYHAFSCCRSYDAIIGVTSSDWFHQLGAKSLEQGITKKEKEKFLRSYILNNYENHLKEIFLAVNNEYSQWDQVSPKWVKEFLGIYWI